MRRYVETLLQYLPWVVVALIVVPAVIGILAPRLLGTYQATASIWVEPSPSTAPPANVAGPAGQYADRLRQFLTTRSFREDILARIHARQGSSNQPPSESDALLSQIAAVEVVTRGNNLIEVEFRGKDPNTALAVVSATIDTFQGQAADASKTAVEQSFALYEQQVQQAESDVASAQSRMSSLPPTASAAERTQLTMDLAARADLLKALEERRTTALTDSMERSVTLPAVIRIVDEPRVDTQRMLSGAERTVVVVAAFVLTLAISLVAMAILTRRDQSVRTPADIRALTPVPIVTTPRVFVPRSAGWPRLARRMFGTSGG